MKQKKQQPPYDARVYRAPPKLECDGEPPAHPVFWEVTTQDFETLRTPRPCKTAAEAAQTLNLLMSQCADFARVMADHHVDTFIVPALARRAGKTNGHG